MLECGEVAHNPGAEELGVAHGWFVYHDLNALGLDPLHNALDRGLAEIVRARLHHQAEHPDLAGTQRDDLVGQEVLAGAVGVDDRADQVLRHFGVIRQQLLGVLGQAVAAIAEAGVVVVRTDTRIEPDAHDHLARIHAARDAIAVELVEESDAHGEVGVGEQLDCLGLVGIGEQDFDVVLLGALEQQVGEYPRPLGTLADDDARRVQVVVQRAPLAQELGAEDDLTGAQALAHVLDEADRDRRLDDDRRLWIMRGRRADHRLDRGGIKLVVFDIVIGRRGDDYVVGAFQRDLRIERGGEVERLGHQERLQLLIQDRRLARVEHVHPLSRDVHRRHFVVLRQKDGVGQPYIAQAENCDLHFRLPRITQKFVTYLPPEIPTRAYHPRITLPASAAKVRGPDRQEDRDTYAATAQTTHIRGSPKSNRDFIKSIFPIRSGSGAYKPYRQIGRGAHDKGHYQRMRGRISHHEKLALVSHHGKA